MLKSVSWLTVCAFIAHGVAAGPLVVHQVQPATSQEVIEAFNQMAGTFRANWTNSLTKHGVLVEDNLKSLAEYVKTFQSYSYITRVLMSSKADECIQKKFETPMKDFLQLRNHVVTYASNFPAMMSSVTRCMSPNMENNLDCAIKVATEFDKNNSVPQKQIIVLVARLYVHFITAPTLFFSCIWSGQ